MGLRPGGGGRDGLYGCPSGSPDVGRGQAGHGVMPGLPVTHEEEARVARLGALGSPRVTATRPPHNGFTSSLVVDRKEPGVL